MTPNRITMITLGVRDLAASKAFYQRLGMVADDSPPSVAFFSMGQMKFGLFGLEELGRELGRPAGQPGQGATTVAINWPSEAAVDHAFDLAIKAGATAIAMPRTMAWGGYSSYWADPDGHVFEYAFNPFWPLDDAGFLAT